MSTDAKSSYRRGVVQGATPVRLVILLYEQLAEDLRRATAALEQGATEARTHHLGHAHEVLGLLQGCLNMNAGQEVAHNLGRFYSALRDNLLRVQFHPDRRVLEKHLAQLLSLREAWIEVERRNTAESKVASAPVAQTSPNASDNQTSQADWRA